MAETKAPAWNMKGTLIIACNCEYGCPCNVNGRPTLGNCEGGWTWQIEQGVYGDVKLDGLNLGLYADWPAAIHEGNGVATTLIDDRANTAQRDALRALLEGRSGGPWAIFRKTFTELHGPNYVPYEVDSEGRLPRVRAGDALTIETEYIRNPVTKETIHPRLALPEGLLLKDAALVGSKRFTLRADKVQYDHSGRYAAFGFFQYFGPYRAPTEARARRRHRSPSGCARRSSQRATRNRPRRQGRLRSRMVPHRVAHRIRSSRRPACRGDRTRRSGR